ncbi:MAG: toxin-antitoxin system YwqK family antitoxin [Acidobacteriota bacterium]
MKIEDSELDLNPDFECSYQGRPFSGVSVEHYPGGEIRSELPYVDGLQHGLAQDWYPSGQLAGASQYRNNQLHGSTHEWYENGQLKSELSYEFGILVSKREWSEGGEFLSTFKLEETSPYRRFLEQARAKATSQD